MKTNDDFVLREVYNTYLLVPVCFNDVSNDIISLNHTGALIYKKVNSCIDKIELLNIIENDINVEKSEKIHKEIEAFIDELIKMKLIIEE